MNFESLLIIGGIWGWLLAIGIYAALIFVIVSFMCFMCCGGEAWLDKLFGVPSDRLPWQQNDFRESEWNHWNRDYWNKPRYPYKSDAVTIDVAEPDKDTGLTDEEWNQRYIGKG